MILLIPSFSSRSPESVSPCCSKALGRRRASLSGSAGQQAVNNFLQLTLLPSHSSRVKLEDSLVAHWILRIVKHGIQPVYCVHIYLFKEPFIQSESNEPESVEGAVWFFLAPSAVCDVNCSQFHFICMLLFTTGIVAKQLNTVQ